MMVTELDDFQGRIRGLLIAIAEQLPEFTVKFIDELIDANEFGVAVETISEMLVDSQAAIQRWVYDVVNELCDAMPLDPINASRLVGLIVDREHAEDE
jgi:hypothetical protein